jgi:hypothetical protein
MADEQIPAGWYPDPAGDTSKIRYWDGSAWTNQTQATVNPELQSTAAGPGQTRNAPIPPQPVYAPGQETSTYVYAAQPKSNGREGMAIASLVLGIVALPTCLCYGLAVIPGILAVVFGILSLKSSRKGMAIAGIICGTIGTLLGVLMIALMFFWVPEIVANPERYGLTKDYIDSIT